MNTQRILFGGILLAGLLLSCSAAAAPFAYIANFNNGTVSVIDTDGNTVMKTVTVGAFPDGIAVSPDGSKVYVANRGDNNVSVINTAGNTVTTPWNVGVNPAGIAVTPDGLKVYVANYGENTVSVINTTTNVITSVTVGTSPKGIAVTPDGSKVYVANQGWTALSVINVADDSLAPGVDIGAMPQGVAMSPDGSKVYVTNSDNNVSVINTTDNTVTNWMVGSSPQGVAVSLDGLKVYVGNSGSSTVSVINTATNGITPVDVGGSPKGIAVTPDGTKVYVAISNSNKVSVINTTTDGVTTPITGFNTPLFYGQFIRPPDATAAPVITTPVYAGATSVSGTGAAGAEIILRYNGIRQAAVTATGGTWSVPVPALATTDTLSVTAWKSPNRMSAPKTATVVPLPPVPAVTSISPSSGTTAGGTSVIITGTSLSGATAVKFGSTSATYTVNSATQITVTSPAGAAGTIDITITTAGGTSATGAADKFTYVAVPTPTPAPVDSSSSSGGGVGGPSVAMAQSVTANHAVSFPFNQITTLTSPVALNTVTITFNQELKDVQVTGMPVTTGGNLPGGTAIGYIQIEPVGINPSMIQQGVISFSVDATWLSEHNIAPAQVVMMRNHDNQWTTLPTTLISSSGSTCNYLATTPGFSYFAVASLSPASGENTPVQNATVTEAIPTHSPVQDTTGASLQTTTKVTTPVPTVSRQPAGTMAAPTTPAAGNGSLHLIATAFAGIIIAAVGVIFAHRR